jgi:hypothetical protein
MSTILLDSRRGRVANRLDTRRRQRHRRDHVQRTDHPAAAARAELERHGATPHCAVQCSLKPVDDDALLGQLVKQSDVEAAFAKARPKP